MSGKSVKPSGGRRFQKIILLLFIPLIFAIVVFFIVAKFTGVDIKEKAQSWLPFLNEEKEQNDIAILEERIIDLQEEVNEKESENVRLAQQLNDLKTENEALQIEQKKLQEKESVSDQQNEDNDKKTKEIILTFEKMSAKAAAPILINMDDAEAIRILMSLKPDTLAAILSKMSPEQAAKYTTMMSN